MGQSPIKTGIQCKFYSNVPYGGEQRNVFDLWVPATGDAKALVIYIHGGGFTGGEKTAAWDSPSKFGIGPSQIKECLMKNVAFASINYSLLSEEENRGVLKCLNDSRRALQYLRFYSKDFGFNGQYIGLSGSSAGAGTALWLAFHDDMAVHSSHDPILEVSTRVTAVAVQETQSTYDIYRWVDDVFPEGKFSIDKAKKTTLGKRLLKFYGASDYTQLESEEFKEYRREVDMLFMISSDDPPLYVLSKRAFNPEKENKVGNLLHSPYHAVALRKMCEEQKVYHEVYIADEDKSLSLNQTILSFLLDQLLAF